MQGLGFEPQPPQKNKKIITINHKKIGNHKSTRLKALHPPMLNLTVVKGLAESILGMEK